MKLSGIIVVLLVMVASCQKEDIRPNGQASEPASLRCSPKNTVTTSNPTPGGGIVDPNTDTDASTTGKKGK